MAPALLAAALLAAALILAHSGAAAAAPALPRAFNASWAGRSPAEKLLLARSYYGNVSVAAALREGTLWVEGAFPMWPAALTETPEVCRSGAPLDVLFAVKTSPPRSDNRMATRGTWGTGLQRATGASAALLFFMGTSTAHAKALESEQRLRGGDLVIADFVDTYRRVRPPPAVARRPPPLRLPATLFPRFKKLSQGI